MAIEPDKMDRDILRELASGRATPSYLASRLNPTRQTIQNRLKTLVAAEYVTRVDTGLYDLAGKGRNEIGMSEADDEVEQLHEQLDRARDRIEKLEAQDRTATDECHEAVREARSTLEDATAAMDISDGYSARDLVESALDTLREVDV